MFFNYLNHLILMLKPVALFLLKTGSNEVVLKSCKQFYIQQPGS